ncbi:MAG TPA: AMP-binding protein [Verrucomicrobiae bacterium]|jgi:phenylacetate-CoA ligase
MTRVFEKAWDETFRYVTEHSPFYRAQFRGLGPAPALEQLPLTEQRDVSERNEDFLCVSCERIAEIVTTSGTTGRPLLWMLTEPDLRRLARNERLSFECAGLAAGQTVLVAVAMDRCFMAGLAYWMGLRELGCAVVRAGAASPRFVLEMIERARPAAIVAVPSFLRIIAERAREMNFDLQHCSVKKAICIGEPVRGQSLALNAAGRAIENAWGARAYSTYGVTELANSLCECEAGAGGHLHEDQLHVEILDDAGRPVPDGEIGEVVATTFGVEAMPLVRYRTGDCAALFRGPCSCGRATPRLGPIAGRKNQKLKVKGVSLFPSTLQTILEETQGVKSFVIIARADAVEVLVEGDAPASALREAMQARAKMAPAIRRAPREEIEALQMPPGARKRRFYVDLR